MKPLLHTLTILTLTTLPALAQTEQAEEQPWETETQKLIQEFQIVGQAFGVLTACDAIEPSQFKSISEFAKAQNEKLGNKYNFSQTQRQQIYEYLLHSTNESNKQFLEHKKTTPDACKANIPVAANNIQIWSPKKKKFLPGSPKQTDNAK